MLHLLHEQFTNSSVKELGEERGVMAGVTAAACSTLPGHLLCSWEAISCCYTGFLSLNACLRKTC